MVIVYSFFFQGNFFQNIGSILLFAILGTVISAVIVGGGLYLLGQVIIYSYHSYILGTVISAVIVGGGLYLLGQVIIYSYHSYM